MDLATKNLELVSHLFTSCSLHLTFLFCKTYIIILYNFNEHQMYCEYIYKDSCQLQSVAVQAFSPVPLFAAPWTAARQSSLSLTISRSLLKLLSIELVMPSNPLILCRPLLLLPSILPSIGVFSNELVVLIRWPKYWSFSISPSNIQG